MATASEIALEALRIRLLAVNGATVLRNSVVPEAVPPGGLIILRDGDPGEPEVTMSPLAYEYWHRAEVEIFVQAATARDAKFDALKSAVGAAITSDRTLDGAVLWCEAQAPVPSDLNEPGAVAVKAALVPIDLVYVTADPLA